jgi:hypothetical protein
LGSFDSIKSPRYEEFSIFTQILQALFLSFSFLLVPMPTRILDVERDLHDKVQKKSTEIRTRETPQSRTATGSVSIELRNEDSETAELVTKRNTWDKGR